MSSTMWTKLWVTGYLSHSAGAMVLVVVVLVLVVVVRTHTLNHSLTHTHTHTHTHIAPASGFIWLGWANEHVGRLQ